MFSLFKKSNSACKNLLKPYKRQKRYHLLHGIGEGGLAYVSSYFDTYLNRVVAVKELKEKNSNNQYFIQSFIREAKLIGYLDHPGVISIYDTFLEKNNKLCYSMKLIEGKRLTEVLERYACDKTVTKIPIYRFLKIFQKLCETLSYVHDKGVIHLDIKPDNILIGQYGEVMVMDWGNARLHNPKPYHTYIKRYMENTELLSFDKETEDMILGTPSYMSPEQTRCSRKSLTPSSDIFSAGIILYMMMTGQHPFPEMRDIAGTMAQIRNHEPIPVHKINSEVPFRLSRICSKMLQKDSSLRYNSFNEVIEDFAEFYNSGQAFSTRKYQTGEIIVKEGDVGEFSFEIISGKVEVSKMVGNEKKVLAQLEKDEIVGELSIFTKQPRTATVIALEPTNVRIMSKKSVERELEKLSPWVGKMITNLSKRFISLNEKIIEIERK